MNEHKIDEALASLTMVMTEFFAPSTDNSRKREIECMLENFSSNHESWKHCLLFLPKTQNEYVMMYLLNTLENIINKKWFHLSDNEKTEIRIALMNELMAKYKSMLYFIRNKFATLLVAIARNDWPHLYPDFFNILEKNAQKEGQSNPPPSPTSGMPQTLALPDLLANAHDIRHSDKTLNMEIVVKCLQTLQHLFSWLPLSSHVPPYLNKLAEFLKLFVSLHFKRLEAEPEFDAIEFLSYLFQFTFQVPSCCTFISCLDIWLQFIDVLKPEDTPKYWEALQALVTGVLNKIQFQHNKAQLQHLDNDTCDDDGGRLGSSRSVH
ncbi:unnamed protein product [Leptidea sinapis]|uniref:Importin N-terminal domain-containing protein n=1 Tax=Leptidea sinapis TaxID=189913 RepID=A0A5E4Q1W8_9NEOP|nr:unnamed protein product [Leptidea sinapis]